MTSIVDSKQLISMAAKTNNFSFALFESEGVASK